MLDNLPGTTSQKYSGRSSALNGANSPVESDTVTVVDRLCWICLCFSFTLA